MIPGGGAKPLTIRTYLRGIADDDRATITRNRFLGTDRLRRMRTRDVAILLGQIAREQTMRREDSRDVLDWERRFTASANRALTTVKPSPAIPRPPRRHTPPMAPTIAEWGALDGTPPIAPRRESNPPGQLVQVLDIFGLAELDLEVMQLMADEVREADGLRSQLLEAGERISQLQSDNNTLVDERDGLLEDVEVLDLEAKDYGEEINDLKSQLMSLYGENGRLLAQLAAAGATETFANLTPTPLPARPTSYTELLDSLAALEDDGIVFTGEDAETLNLATFDTQGKCISKAWDACLTLRDYVRAKTSGAIDQSVAWYLANTPPGYRAFPTTQHAHTETGETRKKHGEERDLPVPLTVHPDGHVRMLEHFKLGKLHRRDPRLYYWDDTTRSGKIYIGYIGTHLTNTQT